MENASFAVKLIIFIVIFVLLVLVIVGLFTTGLGKSDMMTDKELTLQKNRLIILCSLAGFLVLGIISFATYIFVRIRKNSVDDDIDVNIDVDKNNS